MSESRAIVEVVDDVVITLEEPSEDQVIELYESKLDDMVNHFWSATHQLAVEHTFLSNRQTVQAQRQQAALFVVHRSAENYAQELVAHQVWSNARIERAVADTSTAFQQQLLQVAETHRVQLSQSHDDFRAQIARLVASAQIEAVATHEAIADQASQAIRLEHHVESTLEHHVESMLSGMNEQLATQTSRNDAANVRLAWEAMEARLKDQVAQVRS